VPTISPRMAVTATFDGTGRGEDMAHRSWLPFRSRIIRGEGLRPRLVGGLVSGKHGLILKFRDVRSMMKWAHLSIIGYLGNCMKLSQFL